ncbi:hypothetical protein Q7P37_006323 [Cladosporium fusiforme]
MQMTDSVRQQLKPRQTIPFAQPFTEIHPRTQIPNDKDPSCTPFSTATLQRQSHSTSGLHQLSPNQLKMNSSAQSTTDGHTNDASASASSNPKSTSNASPKPEDDGILQAMINTYLREKSTVFRELSDLCEEGWKNTEADKYYARQRHAADDTVTGTKQAKDTADFFYKRMQQIGKQLHVATNAFHTPYSRWVPARILDMCMAPGGFLQAALEVNRSCTATAFTLPVASGGHAALIPNHSNVTVKELDITLLAADMGVSPDEIPASHPDAQNFAKQAELHETDRFDLVICDGQVLRTHARATYRETREPQRLRATQLALGLQHVKPDGTMIVLLHKADQLHNIELLHAFSKISSLTLFKPTILHKERSSFYMIAKDLRTEREEATQAIQSWKQEWKTATFGSEEELQQLTRRGEADVRALLEEIGPTLIELATGVWSVQAGALKRATWR